MKFLYSLILTFCFINLSLAQSPNHYYIVFKTDKGEILTKLYNETPKHRDNFKKLVKEGYYDSLLFHRVIKNFMIQGGDSQSKRSEDNSAMLGNGGPDYKIPAEILPNLIHKRGTLGAARDNNPEKASSASQFYMVQGRKFSSAGLDSLEIFRMNGVKFSQIQRQVYTSTGGTPHLDGNYTVFAEIIKGIEVVDKIAEVETNQQDRPLQNQRMFVRLLTRREAINLEAELAGKRVKNGFFTKLFDSFKSKEYSL